MLACYIPSIMIAKLKDKSINIINVLIVGILVASIALSAFYLYSTDALSVEGAKQALDDSNRMLIISGLTLASIVILGIAYFIQKKVGDAKDKISVNHIILIILVEQIICHVILVSLWLTLMYEIPFIVSASIRIIKMVAALPILTLIVYFVIKYIPSEYKKRLG